MSEQSHKKILVAGPVKRAQVLVRTILADPFTKYRPAGIIETEKEHKDFHLPIGDLPVYSLKEAISQKERFQNVRHILICWPYASLAQLDALVEALKPLEIPLVPVPHLDEIVKGKADALSAPEREQQTGSQKARPCLASLIDEKGSGRRIYLSPPHMGGLEQEYVRRAFQSNFIAPLGPMVDGFEQEFSRITGIPHALALVSGTAAIHLALRVVGVGPGDTVVASTLTFIASATPILFQGATPILIDCDRTSWTMDPNLLEKTLKECSDSGELPKAVIPTDLYGQCSDYKAISDVCRAYGVPLIIDAAEAVGSRYKGGTVPGVTAFVFSFNGNKIITTSGGGMLASTSKDLIDQARFLSQQAREPVPHYEHSQIGYNYRLSNILAAIGLAQLKVLDERVKRKREIFDYYRDRLADIPGVEFMPEAAYGSANRWLTVILITPEEFGMNREQLRLALEEDSIESRAVWKPLHLQPVFDASETGQGSLGRRESYPVRVVGGGVATDLFNRGLCLPSGTQMTQKDLARVVYRIRRCHEENLIPKRQKTRRQIKNPRTPQSV